MKAMLRFDLPEESEEHQTALDGWKWKAAVDEMSSYLRSELKYEDLSDEQDAAFDAAREELFRILNHWDINL